MASIVFNCSFALLAFIILINHCSCFNPHFFNLSASVSRWAPAIATWYGPPDGAGSDGGACGQGDAVEKPPYNKMIAAGNPALFNAGKGCGACYQVKCNRNADCSGNPVTVTITDSCPCGPCASDPIHFDLSWTAFGALAKSGQADQLRNAGSIEIQYNWVPCDYKGFHVALEVDPGSTPNYYAAGVEYNSGDGALAGVDIQQSGSNTWQPMKQSWGATWHLNAGSPLKAPFSIRLTSSGSKLQIVARNVIPKGWKPIATYYVSSI